MVGRVFFTEAKLVLIYYVGFVKKLLNAVIHNSFKDFADVRQKGNGSIVSTASFIIFFVDCTNNPCEFQTF